MTKRVTIGLCIIVVLGIAFGYIHAWTELQIISLNLLAADHQTDTYLEMIVHWPVPKQVAPLLARFVRVKKFTWRDESGQFIYNDQFYGVVDQEEGANALNTLPGERRTVIEMTGKRLSECGIFPNPVQPEPPFTYTVRGYPQRLYFYYGISYTGQTAYGEYTGPYAASLTYSVFGFRRTSHGRTQR
ncbi:MAG: hypothetical protein WAO24_08245 [Peptococcia bacterium]|jgi:hypothetical protein|nr:hypothetical protein [Bacillota bacterium]